MNPADLTLNTSPSITSKPLPAPLSISLKNGKAPVPRVDLEPIYTQLKSALGDQWADYKTAVNAFILGMYARSQYCIRLGGFMHVHTADNANYQATSTKPS